MTDKPKFGQMIRDRRRQLELTQDELAHRIRTSTPYIGHIESGKRHPSDEILARMADVLGFDRRELFFLANPNAKAMLTPKVEASGACRPGTNSLAINKCINCIRSTRANWTCCRK